MQDEYCKHTKTCRRALPLLRSGEAGLSGTQQAPDSENMHVSQNPPILPHTTPSASFSLPASNPAPFSSGGPSLQRKGAPLGKLDGQKSHQVVHQVHFKATDLQTGCWQVVTTSWYRTASPAPTFEPGELFEPPAGDAFDKIHATISRCMLFQPQV